MEEITVYLDNVRPKAPIRTAVHIITPEWVGEGFHSDATMIDLRDACEALIEIVDADKPADVAGCRGRSSAIRQLIQDPATDAIRAQFAAMIPGVSSGSWEDIYERIRELIRLSDVDTRGVPKSVRRHVSQLAQLREVLGMPTTEFDTLIEAVRDMVIEQQKTRKLIGREIRKYRTDRDLSISEFARRLDLSNKSLSALENGRAFNANWRERIK